MRTRRLSLAQPLEERLLFSIEPALAAWRTPLADPPDAFSAPAEIQASADRAGDTWRDALDIGRVNGDLTVRGSAGGDDFADWYRFSLPRAGSFQATLTPEANLDAYLFQKTERGWKLLDYSASGGTRTDRVADDLGVGEYYLLVLPRSGASGDYRLELSPPAAPPASPAAPPASPAAPVASPTAPTSSPTATPVSSSPATAAFSAVSGFGLASASKAVARALGQSQLPSAPALAGEANWGLNALGVADAWAKGITGRNVLVAVIDSGVDLSHPDLAANLWTNPGEIASDGRDNDGNGYVDDVRGWDFVDGDNSPRDENGHGTHVASVVAALRNGVGVSGVAPQARILPVRVLDAQGDGVYSAVARGIRYAADMGADVINLSLGGGASELVLAAIRYAAEKGAVVVMAAGNDGQSSPSYPAAYAAELGIAVGAVDAEGDMAAFSNRAGGSRLDYVTAPGVRVLGAYLNGGYARMSGTSMAAPHVAGIAALVLSANPRLTPAQVEAALTGAASSSSTQSAVDRSTTGVSLASAAAGATANSTAAPAEDWASAADRYFDTFATADESPWIGEGNDSPQPPVKAGTPLRLAVDASPSWRRLDGPEKASTWLDQPLLRNFASD